MYCISFLWLILLYWLPTDASHFRGGTITWKPIDNNITSGSTVSIIITQTYSWTMSQVGCNSSMIAMQSPYIDTGTKAGSGMNLTCNASCSTSGGYIGNEVPITGPCVDYSTAIDLTVSQRSDIVNLTAGAHFTATFGAGGGWQTLALGSSAGWSISCFIDLRVRSDNGLINTPPVATCISYMSVPVNVQQTIQIPVLDADNDVIRCRFANGSSECVNTCPRASLPPGTTLSSSCTLIITGTTAGDYYLVAVQVEDFITNASTTAMSSVPLQFLIYVYATQNCSLEPLLISNINSGVCQGAQVGVNFTMTLTAINRCGSDRIINDIATVSFPIVLKSVLVQNTSNTSLWSMDIVWMPTVNQVGSHVFCAVAVDNASVQSDQYCITLFVGLSSVPLCPGATDAPTTMITTMQSSTVVTFQTSHQQSQDSTGASTMMDITSLSINTTSSSTRAISLSSSSSTIKPQNTTNWALIVGLSLLGLALALCCTLCCCYHLLRFKARRRRKKNAKELEYNFEKRQENEIPKQQVLRHDGKQNAVQRLGSSVTIISGSRVLNSDLTINQREKSPIHNQEHMNRKPTNTKSADAIRQDKVTQPTILDETSLESRTQILSNAQDFSTSTIVRSSASSPTTSTKSVRVKKLPRSRKSSIESLHLTSAVSTKIHPTKSLHVDSTSFERTTTRQQSASNVAVTKIKRSLSAGQSNHIKQRTTTALSTNNRNRVTLIKLE